MFTCGRLEFLGRTATTTMARVQCPVGIKIKSQTVPEIAVSIIAQFIEQRAEMVQEKQVAQALFEE